MKKLCFTQIVVNSPETDLRITNLKQKKLCRNVCRMNIKMLIFKLLLETSKVVYINLI